MAAGSPAERCGRRPCSVVLAVLYFVSAVGCGIAWDWLSLVVFRFIGGLGVGAASVVAPMYIAEISPPKLRGRLVALSQFNVVAGILVGVLLELPDRRASSAGRSPRPGGGCWPSRRCRPQLFFFLVLRIPESPRWLVKQHRHPEAPPCSARWATTDPRPSCARSPSRCTRSPCRPRGAAVPAEVRQAHHAGRHGRLVQPAAGHKRADLLHGRHLQDGGAERTSALLQSVIIGVTNLVFTMVAMTVIDRFGRKRLLLIGAVGPRGLPRADGVGLPHRSAAACSCSAASSATSLSSRSPRGR